MLAKKRPGSPDMIDPDDAPELTVEMLDQAEIFDGDSFVRRGRGRPPLDVRKEQINVRLDPAVLERLRASGPGWQTRINDGLAMLTGIDRRLWDWIETQIARNDAQIELLEHTIRQLEDGTLRSHDRDGDTTHESLKRNRQGIESLTEGNRIMRRTRMDLLASYGAAAAG